MPCVPYQLCYLALFWNGIFGVEKKIDHWWGCWDGLDKMIPGKSMLNDFWWTTLLCLVNFLYFLSTNTCLSWPCRLCLCFSCQPYLSLEEYGGGEGDDVTLYNLVLFLDAAWGVPSLSLSGWTDRNLAELWDFSIMCCGIYFGSAWTWCKNALKLKIWGNNRDNSFDSASCNFTHIFTLNFSDVFMLHLVNGGKYILKGKCLTQGLT